MKKRAWVVIFVLCSVIAALIYIAISYIDDGCFLFSCPSLNIPTKGLEASAVGADYTKLSHLLALKRFEQADLETAEQVLKVTGREQDGRLLADEVNTFPCKDLQTINRLWLGYSNGKFGISGQRKLYQAIFKDLSSKSRQNAYITEDAFNRFAESIGWKIKGKPLSEDELPVNPNGGKGHLPRAYMKLKGCNGITFSLCLLGFPWYSAAPELSQEFFARATSCGL